MAILRFNFSKHFCVKFSKKAVRTVYYTNKNPYTDIDLENFYHKEIASEPQFSKNDSRDCVENFSSC